MSLSPVTLEGRYIRLEPLSRQHHHDLVKAGAEPAIWQWLSSSHESPEGMAAFIDDALASQENGTTLSFAIVDRRSVTAIGSSGYHRIEPAHRRLEIGFTWIAPAFQRTATNTEAKYLMLRHAFDTLGFRRVEFKTDSNNHRSQAALRRIGAVEEGTFRNHMLYPDGRTRDSVYFSIIAEEWPGVKRNLEAKLYDPGTA